MTLPIRSHRVNESLIDTIPLIAACARRWIDDPASVYWLRLLVMIITIDGYAGSGKSTASHRLAEALGFELLNTGGMYRAAGLALMRHGLDIYAEARDPAVVMDVVQQLSFELVGDRVLVNGDDLTAILYTEELGRAASRVGTFPEVRAVLKHEQRRIADAKDIICEGRDQGTAVFPDAPVKFFFYATPEIRAARRVQQLRAANHPADPDQILQQILDRDRQDETRAVDPLRRADDAMLLDTTTRTPDEVHAVMLEAVERWCSRQ